MNTVINTGQSFGERLLILIRQKGTTNKNVADALGVSAVTVTKWTQNGGIDDSHLKKLAKYFNVNYIWLRYGYAELKAAFNACINDSKDEALIQGDLLKDKLICGMLDLCSDEIYIISEETSRFINVSQSALHNTGYSEKELLTMKPYDIKSGLSEQEYIKMCNAVSESDLISFNTTHIKRDNERYNINIKFRKIESALGNIYIAVGTPK